MIRIDQEKCIGCGRCLADCEGGALEIENGKASWVRKCIQCGHCVAVCPTGAVTIPEYDMDEVEEYDPELFRVDPATFLRAVKFRRSIRNYREEPIEHDKLERILNAGRYTATAKNSQATRFILLRNELEDFKQIFWEEMPAIVEGLKKTLPLYSKIFGRFLRLRNEDPAKDNLFFNTTSVLVITAQDPLDGGLAAANIENMAVAEGAGALYSGYLQRLLGLSPKLKEYLGIAEDEKIVCVMLLGYPAVSYKRTAPRAEGHIEWR